MACSSSPSKPHDLLRGRLTDDRTWFASICVGRGRRVRKDASKDRCEAGSKSASLLTGCWEIWTGRESGELFQLSVFMLLYALQYCVAEVAVSDKAHPRSKTLQRVAQYLPFYAGFFVPLSRRLLTLQRL